MSTQMRQIEAERAKETLNPEETGVLVGRRAATFEEVAQRYIEIKEPRWGTHADATAKSVIGKQLIGNLGQWRVEELTAAEIRAFVGGLVSNDASQSLIKKTVTHLRGILDLAQELNLIISNPMRSYTFRLEHKSRKQKSERFLSQEECRALLSEVSGRDRLIVRMFIQLGLRPEELFALRRSDISEESIRIDEVFAMGEIKEVHRAQNGFSVYVPPGLQEELKDWMRSTSGNDNDWLFSTPRPRGSKHLSPIRPATFRNGVLKPAARRAGICHVDMQTLRRTCAAHFGKKANAEAVQAQMHLSSPLTMFKHTPERPLDSVKKAAIALETEIIPATEMPSPGGGQSDRTARAMLHKFSNPLRRFLGLLTEAV